MTEPQRGAPQQLGAPIDRSWDHLEAIASALSNLRGAGSLAHELIQNADDAAGASRLTFRFTDEALIVEDNGGFRKCGDLSSRVCAWEDEGKRPCDFHAFAKLGGATKKRDPDTTGAFGIGFLSVYQVTDRPELFSNGEHWILDEENQQVLPCRSCDVPHIRRGTRIALPWAGTATPLRRKLGADVVTVENRRALAAEFVKVIPECMLFLRRVRRIEVFDGAKCRADFRRAGADSEVEIRNGRDVQRWLVLTASFDDEVQALRDRYVDLAERRAEVSIAVRPGHRVDGRLYATLPTQVTTELPLHLNASFFPRMDRKGILLEAGMESGWNRAAINSAATLLSESLEPLARELEPKGFWSLVNAGSKLDTHHSPDARALAAFWSEMADTLPDACVMWTAGSRWEQVRRTALAPKSARAARLLAELGVPTVSPDIKRLVPWQKLGLRRVDFEQLVGALEGLDIADGCATTDLPLALQDEQQREALYALLAELAAKNAPDAELRERLCALALWEGTDGLFHSFAASYVVDQTTATAFAPLVEAPLLIWSSRRRARALRDLGDPFDVEAAMEHLAAVEPDDLSVAGARRILKWLQTRRGELTPDQVEELQNVPLMPTSTGLRPPRETVRAGGFKDHLSVTGVLDTETSKGLGEIVALLGVGRLKFTDYIRRDLPRALTAAASIPPGGLTELIRECARRRDEIDKEHGLSEHLGALAWVPCRDGSLLPPTEVYFETPAVTSVLNGDAQLVVKAIPRRSGAADFLRALGAAVEPRARDILARVEHLCSGPPTPVSRSGVHSVLTHLATSRLDPGDAHTGLARLCELAWLPADGDSSHWHTPRQLFTTKRKRIFASSGTFIALPAAQQETLARTLTALGVHSMPTASLVVDHVAHLAQDGQAPDGQILKWLDDHASDVGIERLSGIAFLPARDGSLNPPSRVFRDMHPLRDQLPVLEPRVAKYKRLLEALDVRRTPRGDDAVSVLRDAIAEHPQGETSDPGVVSLVRACWQVIEFDQGCDLSALQGFAAVPARDGALWTTGEVVLDDLPGVAKWLDPAAAQRVIPNDGTGSAYVRAGVGRLSERLVARIAGRSRARRNIDLEEHLVARQPHVARIMIAEGGGLERLLRFAERLRVRALEDLRIRYSLSDIDLPESAPVSRGAHYDGATGELVVRGVGLDVTWPEVALSVKEAVLPNMGPSVTLPLEGTLSADTAQQADDFLTQHEFPELSESRWRELRAVIESWRAGRHEDADEPEVDDASPFEDLDGDEGHDDETETRGESADATDQPAAANDEGDDEQETSAPGYGERPGDPAGSGTADGPGRSSAAGRGSGTRRTSGFAGDTKRAGRVDGSERDRDRSGSADRRLISYVGGERSTDEPDGGGDERTAAGEAGVDLVVAHLAEELHDQPLVIEKMAAGNKGYDVAVKDETTGKVVRYIEVKSTEGPWGARGVGMSRPQFELATEEGARFALYVVEELYEREARIWWIEDPAQRVATFQYDEGWKQAAAGDVRVAGAQRAGSLPTGTDERKHARRRR